MNAIKLLTVAAATAALVAAPAWALPSHVSGNSGTAHIPGGLPYGASGNPGSSHVPAGAPSGDSGSPGSSHVPARVGPDATLPAEAKAYGEFCQTESKRHVAGQRGTPFSKCVTGMAKLKHGSETNPARACSKESKRHVDGHRGTPFSICVTGAAKLLGQPQTTTSTTSTPAA